MPAGSETLRADAVVVGTGAGGGPAAAVLAEAGRAVVVLEAGPHLGAADFTGDEGEMTARLWTMEVAADSGLALYAGRAVGGSTVINDAVCLPTPPEVLDGWRRVHGLTGLTDAAFAPFVERAWQDLHATPTRPEDLGRNAQVLARGAARLGWASAATPRSVRGCANLGLCNLGCPSDAKQSTLLTYVPRALGAGARLVPHAHAERVLVAGGGARGVEAVRFDPVTGAPAGRLRVEAPIVCLAAGALGTPALLLRSGLAGTVGHGLQVHTSTHVTARFRTPIHGYFGPTMNFAVTELADVHGGKGPGVMIENTAVHPLASATALPGSGAEHARVMAALPHLARALVVGHDRARGRVTLAGDGRAQIAYTPLQADLERLRHGMTAAARVYLAAGAAEVFLPVLGTPPVRREADLAALRDLPLDPTRFALLYAVHLFGGAAMAGTPRDGACREDGRAWEVAGLWVCDAASLPAATGVNPQVTIVANALRIAAGIAAA